MLLSDSFEVLNDGRESFSSTFKLLFNGDPDVYICIGPSISDGYTIFLKRIVISCINTQKYGMLPCHVDQKFNTLTQC